VWKATSAAECGQRNGGATSTMLRPTPRLVAHRIRSHSENKMKNFQSRYMLAKFLWASPTVSANPSVPVAGTRLCSPRGQCRGNERGPFAQELAQRSTVRRVLEETQSARFVLAQSSALTYIKESRINAHPANTGSTCSNPGFRLQRGGVRALSVLCLIAGVSFVGPGRALLSRRCGAVVRLALE
jgi:hypothetical protein